MKIKVTTERECCHPSEDLLAYEGGLIDKSFRPKFCKHCGSIWVWDRKPGDLDYGYEKVTPTSIALSHNTQSVKPPKGDCPKCGGVSFWGSGVGFHSEKLCNSCRHAWVP